MYIIQLNACENKLKSQIKKASSYCFNEPAFLFNFRFRADFQSMSQRYIHDDDHLQK